jgi:hypothetical protein
MIAIARYAAQASIVGIRPGSLQASPKTIMCSQFAPNVMSTTRNARYRASGNGRLTCINAGGRYWDRTSDLFGVNVDAAAH